jgi:hypothetical protein
MSELLKELIEITKKLIYNMNRRYEIAVKTGNPCPIDPEFMELLEKAILMRQRRIEIIKIVGKNLPNEYEKLNRHLERLSVCYRTHLPLYSNL